MLYYSNMYKLDKQDLIFKALADSKRREILDLLRKNLKQREKSVLISNH